MLISFVIPVLNEQDSLGQLTQEIIRNVGEHSYEIIFIDDGSRDNSFAILSEMAAQNKSIRIIRFRRNFGKAAALQTGFRHASGEFVFTLDADLQDNPIEIPRFIAKLEEGYDLVSGWKAKRRDPWHKTLPSKLFNYVTARTFHLQLKDYNCGFKVYRREVIKELNIYGEMHRYIPALANALGFRIAEISVEHRARIFGVSKYGWERYLRGFFDLLTVKMVTQYIKSPLYLFGRIGLSSTFLGLVLSGYLAALKIFWGQPLSNRPLLFLGMLLILTGFQFISLGLLSELIINRVSDSTKLPISISALINIPEQDSASGK
ncbi:MAG TPA: glycosyltransferase family 2 protein [Candidatus Cloacimonadota bacterium]|nr:glycosyltransferase family 2 protein [Candidatus Cloacimonadota bacterium]